MEKLDNQELKQIQGGLFRLAASKALIGIGVGLSFLIGLVNGFQNPLPCNNK